MELMSVGEEEERKTDSAVEKKRLNGGKGG